jgi:hypothetical protein
MLLKSEFKKYFQKTDVSIFPTVPERTSGPLKMAPAKWPPPTMNMAHVVLRKNNAAFVSN